MRYFDWKTRLDNYLLEMESAAFIWGVTDCCHFAAGAAESMTGKQFGNELQCSSVQDAMRVFIESDRDVSVLADRYFKRINNAAVSYGDIVAVRVSVPVAETAFGDISLGVFLGEEVAVKSADGLLSVPPVFISAWRAE